MQSPEYMFRFVVMPSEAAAEPAMTAVDQQTVLYGST